ncbi:hypothetical protein [Acidocella sp. KAb 2-4]|uniref:hypothetical protein n=1 Tax=Acidocella sp. KAb 2-4 TaxID=2885158 RepID=UPI001D093F65|nr:hypothetical protein [Acidocella sp. KAb 2-4]MCB5943495.1 hypothetical protein [Acidocella sp. KAb 2-4]
MLMFLAILFGCVALLLAAQAMDVECQKPRARRRAMGRSAATQSGYPNHHAMGGAR